MNSITNNLVNNVQVQQNNTREHQLFEYLDAPMGLNDSIRNLGTALINGDTQGVEMYSKGIQTLSALIQKLLNSTPEFKDLSKTVEGQLLSVSSDVDAIQAEFKPGQPIDPTTDHAYQYLLYSAQIITNKANSAFPHN